MRPSVYLCGPITGKSWDEATAWRKRAHDVLGQHGIDTHNPLRFKTYLEGEEKIGHAYPEHLMSTSRSIITRDRFDTMRASMVLSNLSEPSGVSVGSVMEIAWADARRIPTVVVMDKKNPHQHPMINEAVGWVVPTLDDALDVCAAVLTS